MTEHELPSGFRPWGQRGHFWIDTDLYAHNVRLASEHFNRSRAILAEIGVPSGRLAVQEDPSLSSDQKEWMLAFVDLCGGTPEFMIAPSAEGPSVDQGDPRKRLIDELTAAFELMRFKNFLRGPSTTDDGSTTTDHAPS